MTNILVFGAGKSSAYLIKYLLECSSKYFWQVTVADANINSALERIGSHAFGTATQLDIHEETLRKRLIANANIVVSLLPPSMHVTVAKDCIELRKSLITASYVSDEIRKLHEDARNAGLLFMNEIGLDPGIDHMSAMKIIHEIERLGGDIFSFKSYCGGLVAPSSDNNPWHYKISWNPFNIVNAGRQGASYLLSGFEKEIGYRTLFKEIELVNVPTLGKLAAYANRDSLSYMNLYGLQRVKTMMRATFRYPSFCKGWHAIVELGLTDNKVLYKPEKLTYKQWFLLQAEHIEGKSPSEKISNLDDSDSETEELLAWLGVFSDEKINILAEVTSLQILQRLLEQKWAMSPKDKDMVVMQHDFEYGRKNITTRLSSTLIVEGVDRTYTAMAKTVGLPMAIFTKLFITGKVKNLLGVQIPLMKEVYKPILKELAEHGIEFTEQYDH